MVEAQQFIEILLMQMDQAGAIAGLALGFALGLITGLGLLYQAHMKA